jgi:hypothetical protein
VTTGLRSESLSSPYLERRAQRQRRRKLVRWAIFGAFVAAILAFLASVYFWSGATLTSDPAALARIQVEPFGGKLERARAFGPGGERIPLSVADGRLTPRVRLTPRERISVRVTVKRPGWVGWALGSMQTERLSVRAPVARVRDQWLSVPSGSPVRVSFDRTLDAVAYGQPGHLRRHALAGRTHVVSLGHRPLAGSLEVAARARPWERLGSSETVNWFPPSRSPVLLPDPRPGGSLSPGGPIRLTFSQPVSDVLGSSQPLLHPNVRGTWQQTDSHTIAFTPAGLGIPFATHVKLTLPHAVSLVASHRVRPARRLGWTVPPGSMLRLQQLLALDGYLPLAWAPAQPQPKPTPRTELEDAVAPPQGHFSWKYPNTPAELRALWHEGEFDDITRGAVMMFQDTHRLAVDAIPGRDVWHALLLDALSGKPHRSGYSYVYVHSTVPTSLNLWHNGSTILSSPGNTGVPAAPTQLGTFPVFEHIPVGTMSGTNPDGSHYNDPGIKWISYFNHGDAIHAFNRASFGTPQSLGCVELPEATAAKVWPYTPIGTLVTIER